MSTFIYMFLLVTDGAYSGSRNKMGFAYIFVKDDKVVARYSAGLDGGSNNKAELLAIIQGIRSIKKHIDKLKIITDSQYCLGCAVEGWTRNKNKKLWKVFDESYSQLKELCSDIQWVHIRGHGKDNSPYSKYNDIVDKLAVQETL